MNAITRRSFMAFAAGGTVALAAGKVHAHDQTVVAQPWTGKMGGSDPGPQDPVRQGENPDMVNPPSTDSGTLPNLRFSYSDSHVRTRMCVKEAAAGLVRLPNVSWAFLKVLPA